MRFKERLVIDLFLKRGELWEEVQSMRKRWGITASAQVPKVHFPYPQDPAHMDHTRWNIELILIRDGLIPEPYQEKGMDWQKFLAACVLFDPPGTELLEFAEYGGPYPIAPVPWPPDKALAMDKVFSLHMVAPPIKAENNSDGTVRLYIEVTETTTEVDVRHAFRLIKETFQDQQKGGNPGRNFLVALQSAILYDRHNDRDPQDSRRKKWTYEKLAEKFDLSSGRAAKAHVEEGREILSSKLQPKE